MGGMRVVFGALQMLETGLIVISLDPDLTGKLRPALLSVLGASYDLMPLSYKAKRRIYISNNISQ